MSTIEGSASRSFFEEVTTTDATWVEVEFRDINNSTFISRTVILRNQSTSAAAEYSFDPAATKKVHGHLEADDELVRLPGKRADKLYVRRKAVTNVTVDVYAYA
jgi:hypothetical protein